VLAFVGKASSFVDTPPDSEEPGERECLCEETRVPVAVADGCLRRPMVHAGTVDGCLRRPMVHAGTVHPNARSTCFSNMSLWCLEILKTCTIMFVRVFHASCSLSAHIHVCNTCTQMRIHLRTHIHTRAHLQTHRLFGKCAHDFREVRPSRTNYIDKRISIDIHACTRACQEMRARLLQFVTGTSKVPTGGFGALYGATGLKNFQIIRVYDITRLPQVSVCLCVVRCLA